MDMMTSGPFREREKEVYGVDRNYDRQTDKDEEEKGAQRLRQAKSAQQEDAKQIIQHD
jgi:hypothetical protein